ncbi:MAG TPA: hypothetical protein VKZ63_16780 [Kofleriaceae bacterium]|nr:hypothetical protein [Kofleriaceae bacterium]
MANVKGSAMSSRILWVRLNQGQAGIDRLAASVSEPLSSLVRDGAVMSRWYPFEQFIELNLAIDRIFGAGDMSLVRTLGRHGADANLTTIYRLFFKVGTVKWILARASRLWGMHYDSGTLHVDVYPGREVGLRIEGFETPHPAHCLSVLGWAERSVELSGGSEVQAAEVACRTRGGDACRFRASWR